LRRAFAEETDPARLVPACETAWQQRAEELAKADTNPLRSRRPRVTSLEPSAGAVLKPTSPPEYGSRILFAGYQESADDAAHLMLDGGGVVLSVMSSKQTQKMAVYLITKAVRNVIMTVYTYDLLVICEALKSAARRGVKVEVIADYGHTLTGTTVAMVERMKALLAAGVQVVLTKGASGNSGIQHSKTLLCDEHVIVGSCNWTTSSRSNQEMSLLVALNDAGMSSWQERLSYLKRHGRPMTEEDVVRGQSTRDQRKASHSVPPADRYNTARRFSIHARRASARSASRDPTSSA
jgi:phosphatidylserine/phosphatidylglycerophosphate/cardiolipin synthase-like enzyme